MKPEFNPVCKNNEMLVETRATNKVQHVVDISTEISLLKFMDISNKITCCFSLGHKMAQAKRFFLRAAWRNWRRVKVVWSCRHIKLLLCPCARLLEVTKARGQVTRPGGACCPALLFLRARITAGRSSPSPSPMPLPPHCLLTPHAPCHNCIGNSQIRLPHCLGLWKGRKL